MKQNLKEEIHDFYSLDEKDLNDTFWEDENFRRR
jgi:hypothetical protein